MRDMLDAHASAAEALGARILFSCGFDSIPFDLGVQQVQRRCIARWGRPSLRIRCRVRALAGGISGGTAATRRATEAAILLRSDIPAMIDDPFLLTPGWRGADQPKADNVCHDAAIGCRTAPFYMAFINIKHVHRTNYLSGELYGRDCCYDESVAVEGGREAAEARRLRSVLCLAESPSAGGFWTPAPLLDDTLARLLAANAGLRLTDENPATAFAMETRS